MEIISSAAKPVRFSVSMAEALKNDVDRECSRRGVSLSILLEKAVRAYLKKPAGK
jgi:metal-responsive CopG/Arc/MetJ family transcriptional regulator